MKGKRCTGRKSESGMIVVEATLSFMIFIFVVLSIITLTNVFVVHNKMQFAANSAANHLASYSYLYYATGAAGAERTIISDGASYVSKLDDVMDFISDTKDMVSSLNGGSGSEIYSSYNQWSGSANKAVQHLEEPKDILIGVGYSLAEKGIQAGKNAAANVAIKPMTNLYLSSRDKDAKEYLKSFGLKDDPKFTMKYLDGNNLVDVSVEYEIEIPYLKLLGIDPPTLKMKQRAIAAAWLDGDGHRGDVPR